MIHSQIKFEELSLGRKTNHSYDYTRLRHQRLGSQLHLHLLKIYRYIGSIIHRFDAQSDVVNDIGILPPVLHASKGIEIAIMNWH